jgi:hypothetical protein
MEINKRSKSRKTKRHGDATNSQSPMLLEALPFSVVRLLEQPGESPQIEQIQKAINGRNSIALLTILVIILLKTWDPPEKQKKQKTSCQDMPPLVHFPCQLPAEEEWCCSLLHHPRSLAVVQPSLLALCGLITWDLRKQN